MKKYFYLLILSCFVIPKGLCQIVEEKSSASIYDMSAATLNYFEFSSDQKFLAISAGNYARLYTWEDRKIYMVLKHRKAKADNVSLTKFSPDNKFVATIGHTGEIMVWDIETKKESKDLSQHSSWLPTKAFLSETYGLNEKTSIYGEQFIQAFSYNKDSSIIASALENKNATPRLIDIRFKDNKGKLLQTLTFDNKDVYYFSNSPGGSGAFYKLNLKNKLEPAQRFYPSMIFSPDGEWFIVGNTKGKAAFYKVLH